MTIFQIDPNEPLSPELVLILPREARAHVLATLGAPTWPAPRPRTVETPTPPVEPFARALAVALCTRDVQLTLVFIGATLVTLAMSLVALAVR